jgi:hypothetical protein
VAAATRLRDVIDRQRALHQPDQIGDLLRENVAAVVVAGSDCLCRAHIAAWRAADAEVDAVRKQRFEHHELLGHLERAVVRQHHAAGAEANPLGDAAKARQHHLGAGVRHAAQPVMLGAPVARVAEIVGELREFNGGRDRVRHRVPVDHGRLIEHGK